MTTRTDTCATFLFHAARAYVNESPGRLKPQQQAALNTFLRLYYERPDAPSDTAIAQVLALARMTALPPADFTIEAQRRPPPLAASY